MAAATSLSSTHRVIGCLPRYALCGMLAVASASAAASPRHAIAMHGEPALSPDFTSMRYANPAALTDIAVVPVNDMSWSASGRKAG